MIFEAWRASFGVNYFDDDQAFCPAMGAHLRVVVELFFGDLHPWVFDLFPPGLVEFFLSDVKLCLFVL